MVSDIEVALEKCQKMAQQGYEMACNEQLFLRGIITDMRDSLDSADAIQSVVYSRLPDDMVFRMHAKALWELEKLDEKLTQDLDLHRENLDEFHIVVFGRTMVGKSTLMEILTHGNGASIGKGGQRTTRDVRSYHWQGMRVTDVPGIGSFEGREDDRLAMEAAKTADLILFLVSDDAPQQDEAEKLAELRDLGKPILILMNVKLSLDGYPERRSVLLKKLAKKMADTERLAEIEEQFRDFASVYGQDWSDIAFVHSHLNAAYISAPKRADDSNWLMKLWRNVSKSSDDDALANDSELYELSNFSAVESFLLEKIRNEGAYYRLKTFVEAVRVPMQETKEALDKLDSELRAKYDGIPHRILVLEKFKTQYLEEVQEYRIPELHETLRTQVGRAIHIAATNHYDDFDEAAGEQLSKQIGEICQEECSAFLEQEQDIWDRKRWELEDGLDVDMGVSMQNIEIGAIDTGSAGDTVSKLFKYAAWANWLAPGGPLVKLGLSVGMGVLSSIFGRSTEEKIADLEKEINKKVEPVFDKVVDSVIEALNGGIIANMNSFEVMLEEVEELYRSVGDENVEAYNKLYYRLQDRQNAS